MKTALAALVVAAIFSYASAAEAGQNRFSRPAFFMCSGNRHADAAAFDAILNALGSARAGAGTRVEPADAFPGAFAQWTPPIRWPFASGATAFVKSAAGGNYVSYVLGTQIPDASIAHPERSRVYLLVHSRAVAQFGRARSDFTLWYAFPRNDLRPVCTVRKRGA